MKVITRDILRLYESFGGDLNSCTQNRPADAVYGFADCWRTIEGALQDAQLICGRKVSDVYTARVLGNWKDLCDPESFAELTGKIHFYADFQSVAGLLEQIGRKITPSSDTSRAGFDSPEIFMVELKHDINKLRHCSFTTLQKVYIEFSHTSTYRELSAANGWHDEYLQLAETFDQLNCRLSGNKECEEKRKVLRSWWKFW